MLYLQSLGSLSCLVIRASVVENDARSEYRCIYVEIPGICCRISQNSQLLSREFLKMVACDDDASREYVAIRYTVVNSIGESKTVSWVEIVDRLRIDSKC